MRKAGLNPDERLSGNKLGTPEETFEYPTKKALGQKGTTAGMYFKAGTKSAPAANVVLIETFNNYTSQGGKDAKRAAELDSFVKAILGVFLRK
jgi:hypothetical protein